MKYLKRHNFLLLTLVALQLSLVTMPSMAYRERLFFLNEFEIDSAKWFQFQPPRKVRGGGTFLGLEYDEAVVLEIAVNSSKFHALARRTSPFLVIGSFVYPIIDAYRNWETLKLIAIFHIHNQEQLNEGEPMLLSSVGGRQAVSILPEYVKVRFSHTLVEDVRWTVIGGFVVNDASMNLRRRRTVPYAIVKINGGSLSLTTTTSKTGWFNLNYPNGIQLEDGQSYRVEILVNEVVLYSENLTRETAQFPEWYIDLEPQEATFYEIKGYLYDTAGNPIPEVILTLDEHHTATTDENGYYRLVGFFAGTYTLTATKEGYTFAPVQVTGSNGQPVTIDLVEKQSTQCLLYAVHNTAQNKGRLKWVNPAEDLTIQNLPFSPEAHQISVAVADFDGDLTDEIAMAVQTGGHTITLAEFNGLTLRSITAPMNGMLLATGDLDGDEQPEIVAASRSANRNSVQSYAPDGQLSVISYQLTETIKLFEDNTRIAPALGDVDGDGKDDIIAGSLLKADQVVISHSATQQRQTFSVFQATQTTRKKTEKQKPQKPMYGVQVATGDFDGDGKDEIVAAQASKGSRVEIYNADGALQNAFEAFESQKGVVITVGNVIGDESPEILVGEAKGNLIRGFSVNGELLFEFEAVKKGIVSSLAVFGCLE
jgi:hypothetical protein